MAFLDRTGVERLWAHIISKLGEKVDRVEGKGLSTNDYTDEEKAKLANIDLTAGTLTIDTTLTASGEAADAKTVGDLINDLQARVAELESILNSNNYLVADDG